MLELTVKTLDSQNHSFTVPNETTVRQLKENILEKMEVPVEIQRLIFQGKVLQDEKKLMDYGDVHGKVIHLVQRPPPPSRAANTNNGSESNQRTNTRRSHYSNRDRADGNNSTYLGTMGFPVGFINSEGIFPLPPCLRLPRRRLLVAQRMLNQAGACITALENNEGHPSSASENSEPTGGSNSLSSNASGNGREEADIFLGDTAGSIAQAAQAATAAAIAAAVSAAHSVVVPHITIRGASENHPEDVAVEVEIGGNSDVTVDECHDGDSIANNLDNNPSGSNIAPPRSSAERTSAFATLIEQLEEQQRRFQTLLRKCHQIMVEDPSLTENSSPNAEECQRLFNGVSETMHHFAHAYHALSDIMVDFNEDTPRTLRCRPVAIRHSAIVDTVLPIQAQINLGTRRNTNESSSNLSSRESNHPNVNTNPPNSQLQDNVAHENSQNAGEVPQDGDENVIPQESASSFASTATQQSEERSQSSHSGGLNNTPGFFLSSPGNLEVFMDLRPESVTLGSVETTVILDNENRGRSNTGGGYQFRNYARSPIELLHSMAGQIHNHLREHMNHPSQTDQPPPYEANVQQSNSETVMSNQSASSRAQSSASTDSTRTAPNTSNSRPHVHFNRTMPDVTSNMYDPFLPCSSHHIRPQNRSQNRNANAQATSRNANETERSNTNGERDPFMAMMSHMLHPQTVIVSRGQPRQGTSNVGFSTATSNATSSRNIPRRQNTQAGQTEQPPPNDLPRNFVWASFPNSIAGWSISTSPSTSPGSGRNFFDHFRLSSNRDASNPNQFASNGTIAEFLSTIYDSSYVEGESLISDFLMTLAQNLTWPDLIELSIARRTVVESIVTRLQPALQTFVLQRLLQGEAPSEESITRACERLYSELRPYVDVMQVARLRESVDLAATINNFNQSQIPEIVGLIVDSTLNQSSNFGQTMTQRVKNYIRQLMAIIIHCCQDGVQGFDSIVQSCVRLLTRGVPDDLQQWTEINSVNNLRYYTATLNVPLEEIQRYFVYRIPNCTAEKNEPTENAPEPMETDTTQNRTVWIQSENITSFEKVEEPITESLVDSDADSLPDVLIGSETWHNALPSEWVPIITGDTQRQRRQSSQKPFSDAYLSSLPPKRRKLITSSKPHGSISQVISDGVRHAITAAGVNSNVAEKAIAEAGKDNNLQEAYKEQERVVVGGDLKKDPDFTPNRFPNAFKYFNK